MRLAWMAHTGPDLLLEISKISQVTEYQYMSDKQREVKNLNNTIEYEINNRLTLKELKQ